MRHTKTIPVPETTRTVLQHVSCDMCKKQIRVHGVYGVDEICVSRRVGFDYGSDGGSGTETEVDLCGECFSTKLLPWLRSQGADVRTENWEH